MEFPEGMSIFLYSSEKALVLYLYIACFMEKALKENINVFSISAQALSGTGVGNLQAFHSYLNLTANPERSSHYPYFVREEGEDCGP